MREKDMEKRAVRTVRRKKIQDLLAVLFFLLLLPYTCAVLIGQEGGEAGEKNVVQKEEEYVYWEQKNGVMAIPVDEFLTGALAASIPAEYRQETLKAQAVILRSICEEEMAQGGRLKKEDSQLEYLEEEARRQLWGEDFTENEKRFAAAVQDTGGLVLCQNKEVVSPPYFRLSAGKTRSGSEILGETKAAWCHSVDCPHDLEADEFLQEERLGRAEFTKKLAEEGMVLPQKGAKLVLTRDSAGYVVSVSCEDAQMEGEKFRKLFQLASSCFYLKEENGEIIIQTKGVGHGLGFDQYGADLLAAEGYDYMELLNFFFAGLTLEKME